jgi:hypothetical protein
VRRGRTVVALQILVLLLASLLEVEANFAATDLQSGIARFLARIALPTVVVLLLLLVAGNVVMLRLESPSAPQPRWDADRPPYPWAGCVHRGRRGGVLRARPADR